MTTEANRLSDVDLKVGDVIYRFDAKASADAFQRCLSNNSLDACAKNHAAVSTRLAKEDQDTDEPAPGSIISPSLGGMP